MRGRALPLRGRATRSIRRRRPRAPRAAPVPRPELLRSGRPMPTTPPQYQSRESSARRTLRVQRGARSAHAVAVTSSHARRRQPTRDVAASVRRHPLRADRLPTRQAAGARCPDVCRRSSATCERRGGHALRWTAAPRSDRLPCRARPTRCARMAGESEQDVLLVVTGRSRGRTRCRSRNSAVGPVARTRTPPRSSRRRTQGSQGKPR